MRSNPVTTNSTKNYSLIGTQNIKRWEKGFLIKLKSFIEQHVSLFAKYVRFFFKSYLIVISFNPCRNVFSVWPVKLFIAHIMTPIRISLVLYKTFQSIVDGNISNPWENKLFHVKLHPILNKSTIFDFWVEKPIKMHT